MANFYLNFLNKLINSILSSGTCFGFHICKNTPKTYFCFARMKSAHENNYKSISAVFSCLYLWWVYAVINSETVRGKYETNKPYSGPNFTKNKQKYRYSHRYNQYFWLNLHLPWISHSKPVYFCDFQYCQKETNKNLHGGSLKPKVEH